jgi:hypothetical protein
MEEFIVKPVFVPTPLEVVTATLPEVPFATTAVIVVAFTTEKEVASVPPKLTEDAPVKFVPEIVIVVPGQAEFGVKDEIVGIAEAVVKLTWLP